MPCHAIIPIRDCGGIGGFGGGWMVGVDPIELRPSVGLNFAGSSLRIL